MISLREVQRLAFETRMPEQAIERDYVLTWVLSEIARHPMLGAQAILKGGTAIKKLYFSEWRYSEDLDFTLQPPWAAEPLVAALEEVNATCASSAGLEVAVSSQEPRPETGQLSSLTIYLAYIGPLRRTRRPRELKLDFTNDEVVVEAPVRPRVEPGARGEDQLHFGCHHAVHHRARVQGRRIGRQQFGRRAFASVARRIAANDADDFERLRPRGEALIDAAPDGSNARKGDPLSIFAFTPGRHVTPAQ